MDIFKITLNFSSSDQQQVVPNISFQLIFLTQTFPTSAIICQLLFCFEVTEENPIRKSSCSFPILHIHLEFDNSGLLAPPHALCQDNRIWFPKRKRFLSNSFGRYQAWSKQPVIPDVSNFKKKNPLKIFPFRWSQES